VRANLYKTVAFYALAVASLAIPCFITHDNLILSVLLTLITLAMFLVMRDIRVIAVFAVAFLFGPLAEVLAIRHGLWRYKDPLVLGIPPWLPLLWGIASLFIVRVYLDSQRIRARPWRTQP